MKPGLFSQSGACLAISSALRKCQAVTGLWHHVINDDFIFDPHTPLSPVKEVGRPPRPTLVSPSQLNRRRLGSSAGRAALVHAIAHIEFNAINLALDAAHRFRNMPRQYYIDWISVAADEVKHFRMLDERLHTLGHEYGDFPAHDGLWEMAGRTADDCMLRMALVPRVLEARGLDVTPGMIERLEQVGDMETARILKVILREEIRHVEIGSHWFGVCCDQRNLEPEATFLRLLADHWGGAVRGPFNIQARIEAGFSQHEMDAIKNL